MDTDTSNYLESPDYLEELTSEIVGALTNIEAAIEKVEEAVKEKSSTPWIFSLLIGLVIGVGLVSLAGELWHSKWRYALAYDVPSDKIHIISRPHDCDFLTAPLGKKNCQYERRVSTFRWATSTTGHPIISFDDGKTWDEFTPDANTTVPRYSTVEQVYINWEKKDDD